MKQSALPINESIGMWENLTSLYGVQYGLEWEERRLLELGYGMGYGEGRKQEVGCHSALLKVLIHLSSVNNVTPFSPLPTLIPL